MKHLPESSPVGSSPIHRVHDIPLTGNDPLPISEADLAGQGAWCFMSLGDHEDHQEEIVRTVHAIQERITVSQVVVIGIGGSSLGARALAALVPSTHKITFLESVDVLYTSRQLDILERDVHAGASLVCCMISKSGKTPETVLNSALMYERLQRWYPTDYAKRIVVISTVQSPLAQLAHTQGWTFASMPPELSGRYSVFSAVGMVPLALAGVDVPALWRGARQPKTDLTAAHIEARAWAAAYTQGISVHDIIVSSPALVELGLWLRQLIGEGLGKTFNTPSPINPWQNRGPTPTVFIATDDFHSVFQQQITDASNRFITSIIVEYPTTDVRLELPDHSPFESLMDSTVTVTHVHNKLMAAFGAGYSHQQIPRTELIIKTDHQDTVSAETMGYVMNYYLCVVALTGILLKINPFDQPYVERYKCPNALWSHGQSGQAVTQTVPES